MAEVMASVCQSHGLKCEVVVGNGCYICTQCCWIYTASSLAAVPTATPPTCATCHFLVGSECRKSPPEPALSTTPKRGNWPLVQVGDWCGEYRGKGQFK